MGQDFDSIVIGGGIAGLVIGNYLAAEGHKVLLVEKNPFVGGYCSSFTNEGYHFDAAATMISGFGKEGYVKRAFNAMKVSFEEELIYQPSYEEIIIGNKVFTIPEDFHDFMTMLKENFPEDARGLDEYLQLVNQIYEEMERINDWTEPVLTNFQMFPKYYPVLFKEKNTYLEEALNRYFTNPLLKNLFKAQCFRLGLIPETTSLINFAGCWCYTYKYKPIYFTGGVGKLAEILLNGLKDKGGEIILAKKCEKILMEEAKAVGVQLEDGSIYQSNSVISNIDATETFFKMVGKEYLKRSFISKLERMVISPSAFITYLGLSCSLKEIGLKSGDLWYFEEEVFTGKKDLDEVTFGWNRLYFSSPSLKDNSLKKKGGDSLLIIKTAPYKDVQYWKENARKYGEEILHFASKVFPGLKDKIEFLKYHTPVDFEKITNNRQGAVAGWSPIPSQSGFLRLPRDTPIPGLYLTGHWTGPGSGVMSAIISGMKAGQLVLNAPKEGS